MKSKNYIELIPTDLQEDYLDFTNKKIRNVLRAVCLRRYLEGSINKFFEQSVKTKGNISNKKWKNYTLEQKIEAIDTEYGSNFKERYYLVRKIGNKGAHFGNDISDQDIEEATEIAVSIIQDVFVQFFIENSLINNLELMSLFSILPPEIRISVLLKLVDNGQKNKIIFEKIAKALVKANRLQESYNYLMQLCIEEKITEQEYSVWMMECSQLHQHLDMFDVSMNIDDVKRKFKMYKAVFEDQKYDEFVRLFTALLNLNN